MDTWPERFTNRLRPWVASDIEKLRGLLAQETPYPVMAAILGRSQESIRTKARNVGLIGGASRQADTQTAEMPNGPAGNHSR